MARNDASDKDMEETIANTGAGQSNIVDVATTNKAINVSPYYLHPSYHPGLIFVTHPLSENGDNYFMWRHSFVNALQSKNKAGFVDGMVEKLDVDSPDLQLWIQCNAMVISWLTNALAKELQGTVAHVETTSVRIHTLPVVPIS